MRVRVRLAPPAAPLPRAAAAIVVDVLRATSTLSVALDHGAARILPAASVASARALAARTPGALLCGEREGLRIDGFDLGNSPFEYGADVVRGRPLVFASTNGSRALIAARRCRRRVLAAFVNAPAAAEAVAREREVEIVCAGSLGAFALEDAACAGWIAARLAARGARLEGAAARLAAALAPADAGAVRALVEGASHGRSLRAFGAEFARDVAWCATLGALERAFEA